MENKRSEMIKAYYQKYRKKQFWRKLVSVLGCLVVFCTTYALILPAITMDQNTICGMTEHQHTSDCYIMPESGHVHTDACYTETVTYICGMEETEDDGGFFEDLFDDESSTSSTIEYEPAHSHTDACMEITTELTCGLEEAVPHSHDDTCYDENGELICELPTEPEEPLLICDITPHIHSDGCFPSDEEDVTEDGSTDNEKSDTSSVTEEEGNESDDEVTEDESNLSKDESLLETVCGMEEHLHKEDCYDADGRLVCIITEHRHAEGCYQTDSEDDAEKTDTICGKEEHRHIDNCYDMDANLICIEEEHLHEESCYPIIEDENKLQQERETVCGAAVHQHEETCYDNDGNLICSIEEHQHDDSCYADLTADIETPLDWEKLFAGIELTGIWGDDLVAVAESQLGYRESSRNVILQEDGNKKGYTRYGDWYGDPYGDWCAMFISFCLHYAEIPQDAVPYDSNCISWIKQLKGREMYQPVNGYIPEKGDIVFFDLDMDGSAEHVGLVAERNQDKDVIRTLEGNNGPAVARFEYALSDERILGYGVLPKTEEGLCHQTLQAVIYTDSTYETRAEDANAIYISGILPVNAEARAYPVKLKLDMIDGQSVILAYDIAVFDADGNYYEPEEDTEMLTISIQPETWQIDEYQDDSDISEETEKDISYTAYYIPEDGMPEAMNTSSDTTMIEFQTDHFSVYAVTVSEVEKYVLPETGGNGVLPFMAGGLLAIGTAGAVLINSRRKNREEDFTSF